MAIGQKAGSLKNLKKSLAKGSGQGTWIKYIPKNGSLNVRFIQEPEEWFNYNEHFDSTIRRSYPCSGEDSCPGCTTGERKSTRYLANAVDVDTDRVIPLQMPKDLANRLVVRYERNGTLTDRDFELSRTGEGLDTVYDLDAGVVDRKKISKYQPLDLEKVLDDAYNEVFGDDQDDDSGQKPSRTAQNRPEKASGGPVKVKGGRKRSKAADELEPDDDDGVDDDQPKKPSRRKSAAASALNESEPEFTPEEDEGDEDDEGEFYDENTLRSMPLGALRAVAREFQIDTKGKSQDALVDEILDAGDEDGGDDGDDEPPF